MYAKGQENRSNGVLLYCFPVSKTDLLDVADTVKFFE